MDGKLGGQLLAFLQLCGFHSEVSTGEDGGFKHVAEGQVEAFESEQVKVREVNEAVDPEILRDSRVGEKRLLGHGV